MQITLMNFGDNKRVIHDIANKPTLIDIGQMRKMSVNRVTFNFIKACAHTDPLVMVPDDLVIPAPIKESLMLLGVVDTEEYDSLLSRTTKLTGVDYNKMRPSRGEIRELLRHKSESFCRRYAVADATFIEDEMEPAAPAPKQDGDDLKKLPGVIAGEKKVIHDDKSPKELEREQRKPAKPPATPKGKQAKSSKQSPKTRVRIAR